MVKTAWDVAHEAQAEFEARLRAKGRRLLPAPDSGYRVFAEVSPLRFSLVGGPGLGYDEAQALAQAVAAEHGCDAWVEDAAGNAV